jgi:hypothetical protein
MCIPTVAVRARNPACPCETQCALWTINNRLTDTVNAIARLAGGEFHPDVVRLCASDESGRHSASRNRTMRTRRRGTAEKPFCGAIFGVTMKAARSSARAARRKYDRWRCRKPTP